MSSSPIVRPSQPEDELSKTEVLCPPPALRSNPQRDDERPDGEVDRDQRADGPKRRAHVMGLRGEIGGKRARASRRTPLIAGPQRSFHLTAARRRPYQIGGRSAAAARPGKGGESPCAFVSSPSP